MMTTTLLGRRVASAALTIACLSLPLAPSALADPDPTATPTPTPTAPVETSVPGATTTPAPSSSDSATPTATTTPAPTTVPEQPTGTPTATASPTPTVTPTGSPTEHPTATGTASPAPTSTPTGTSPTTPTASPSASASASGNPSQWDGEVPVEGIPGLGDLPVTPLKRGLRLVPGCRSLTITNPAGNPLVGVAYGGPDEADLDGIVALAPGATVKVTTTRSELVVVASDGNGISFIDGGPIDQVCDAGHAPLKRPTVQPGRKGAHGAPVFNSGR
ncbi:hypothetical protein [Arsenicicoccus dermatophilus]|uniref:hypothetical protein n=1 Tax=Arsenicicoccus dermatophilus TaxID=1076331 RepID=UPI001F4C6330|nr:hypothetical protein [Arsenicicoccus dermatophilus]MCH8613661.1 hypothetical protein [Arsenicicoccus dermatophilus]